MRHPFDGIQEKKETTAAPAGTTRRGALAMLGGLLAGLFGWRAVATAAVAPPRPRGPVITEKVGEDGGPSTAAAFEEGGRPPHLTTKATGEEGGRPTKALYEDGRWPTTLKTGEEGGRPPRLTEALHEGGWDTTMAAGEEGGARPTTLALFEEGARPPATTMAYPEAGGKRRPWEE